MKQFLPNGRVFFLGVVGSQGELFVVSSAGNPFGQFVESSKKF